MQRSTFRGVLGCAVLMFGLAFLSSVTNAQIPPVDIKKDAPKFQETTSPLSEMREGKRKILDPDKKVLEENRAIMSRMAKWMAYRLNVPPYNGEPDGSKEGSPSDEKPISLLLKDAIKWYSIPLPGRMLADDQAIYAQEYGKAMEKEVSFVLKNASKPIVRVNAARMLAQIALMPCDALADSYLAILKDEKELDAVKLYACEGLRDLLQHSDRIENQKHLIRDVNKQAEIANTLIELISRKHTASSDDPEAQHVVQFVRREAVRALGAFRDSVIRTNTGKVLATPGLTLIRVAMADTSFVPEISLSEQVEALMGFCSMRIDKDTELTAATHAVNIATQEIIERQNPSRLHPGRERSVPWKIVGAKMQVALNQWKTNSEALPVAMEPKLIVDMVKMLSDSVYSKFEESGISAQPAVAPLTEWYRTKPLKSKQLFKSDAASVLEWVKPVPAKKDPNPK